MKNTISILLIICLLNNIFARPTNGKNFKLNSAAQKVAAGCNVPQQSAELSINNVRTLILSGGDMWWDALGTSNAFYYVPKTTERSQGISSNFAGFVWFGGKDAGGQLKVASQTYRQQAGVDFWTGPLSQNASITQETCLKWDKIFKITRAEVDAFVLAGGPVTPNIANWPANGDLALQQDNMIAPYVDVNNNGIYDPAVGKDYPYYAIKPEDAGYTPSGTCKSRLFGDETLFWVYNDIGGGNAHGHSKGPSIGLEVRAQAFAFKTADEINNMTFYNYQIINKSSFELKETYMAVWTDADLGNYKDDYIGCDVKRGLAYIYNADNNDETTGGVNGYGSIIPALGCDFFQGPVNTTNGIDDNCNGTVDEPGEQMGMTRFTYFNNSGAGADPNTTDPDNGTQVYNYMTGKWKDGTPFTCGANGRGGSVNTNFVYPGNSMIGSKCGINPCGDNWTEFTAKNTPDDRRFIQSSGPFTLTPGNVTNVTIGLPWARSNSTDQLASIDLLKIADDKAQALFDNCFKVVAGPDAPEITMQELNNELILYFTTTPASNNYLYSYFEKDPTIVIDSTTIYGSSTNTFVAFKNVDATYKFEGFLVYQLKNEAVTVEEITNPDKAKLAFSCDIKNDITTIINYVYDPSTNSNNGIVKVQGKDNDLSSSFRFTKDLFSSTSAQKVVNHKPYYFMVVAYAYNNYGTYKQDQEVACTNCPSKLGQKLPFLQGRKITKAYGIPHDPSIEKNGIVTQAAYGFGPKITRIEGQGNGGNILDLTPETVDAIMASPEGRMDKITYQNAKGPIKVTVVDPLSVPKADFAVYFIKKQTTTAASLACSYSLSSKIPLTSTRFGALIADSVTWVLKNLTTGKEYVPCASIKIGRESYFPELGLSVTIAQVNDIAGITTSTLAVANPTVQDRFVRDGDILDASIEFSEKGKNWLTGISDGDFPSPINWIRSGSFKDKDNIANSDDYYRTVGTSNFFYDPTGICENILGGTWAPYFLTSAGKPITDIEKQVNSLAAPAFTGLQVNGNIDVNHDVVAYDLRALPSIDLIITKDKSKWTRAIVFEEADDVKLSSSGARKLEPRRSLSVDKQGNPIGSANVNMQEALIDTNRYGLGWFPGYAINIETGERLQIGFGEDSYQRDTNNGADMMWNPTSNFLQSNLTTYANFGGRHYIYVFGTSRSKSIYNSNILELSDKPIGVPNYTEKNFKEVVACYKYGYQQNNNKVLNNFWSEAAWVTLPVTSTSYYNFKNPADMPCDVKVRLRVKKPYRTRNFGLSYAASLRRKDPAATCPLIATDNTTNSTIGSVLTNISADSITNSVNNNMPYYTFNTNDIFTINNNSSKLTSALDNINIVPNPYYAYSEYEQNRVDTRVRITNLPNKCTVKIFSIDGVLIRTLNRDVTGQEDLYTTYSDFKFSNRQSYLDWDVKNQNGISVASGLYLIHIIEASTGKEKVVKWFGVMRPLDLESF